MTTKVKQIPEEEAEIFVKFLEKLIASIDDKDLEKIQKMVHDMYRGFHSEKRCYKCGVTRSTMYFHKDSSRYDGLCAMCRFCVAEKTAIESEKRREVTKEWREAHEYESKEHKAKSMSRKERREQILKGAK